jgi:hypothetical protein
MKLETKRGALIVSPENDADRAFIEDTLGATSNGGELSIVRVDDVALGFQKPESFCLKISKPEAKP